jgi:hypothetical protein
MAPATANSRHRATLAGAIQRHGRSNVTTAPTAALEAPAATPEPGPELAPAAALPEAAEQPTGAAAASSATSGRLHLAAILSAPPQPRIELAADSYTVLPGEPAARIEVRRRGNLQGDVSFVWSTESASAQPERDFIASGPRAEQMPAGVTSMTLLVPIVSDATRTESRVFYVTIGEPGGGAELGTNARASVLVAGGN